MNTKAQYSKYTFKQNFMKFSSIASVTFPLFVSLTGHAVSGIEQDKNVRFMLLAELSELRMGFWHIRLFALDVYLIFVLNC